MGFGVMVLIEGGLMMVLNEGGLMMVAGWVNGGCGLIIDGG